MFAALEAEYDKKLIWKDVLDFKRLYKVSNMGHVVSVERTCFSIAQDNLKGTYFKAKEK